MHNFSEMLDKYAELIVKVGLNLQKNQELLINVSIECAEFARLVVKKAYTAGAKNVYVEWEDEQLTVLKHTMAPDEAFTEYPAWKAEGYNELCRRGAAFLFIHSKDPDLLKQADPKHLAAESKARGQAWQEFRRYMNTGEVTWLIAACPSEAWAAKVFPVAGQQGAVEKLWNCILKAARVELDGDPVRAWNEHIEQLTRAQNHLNGKKYVKLHYHAPGTDLSIELTPKHKWASAKESNRDGTSFIPNIPTEEVFTLPLKDGVNGVVHSSKPLSYNGNLIDNFSITFEKGRIIDFTAEKGYETLKQLIETDEGSHYLGEVALVPHNSPISNMNVVFYNTLFDENASCHLAIGFALLICLEGGTKMSKEELQQHGANTSITHVDFMIGSAELNIDGETDDGTVEPIMRKGNWAF